MKQILALLLTYTLLAGNLLVAQSPASPEQQPAQGAAPAQPSGYGGNVFVGTRGLDNNNYLGRVSEYDTSRQGLRPSIGAGFWGQNGNVYLDFRGEHRGDARDQQYSFQLDAGGYFKIRTTYDRFIHRLDHDPLSILDAAKGSVVVRSNDFAPGAEYVPGRNEVRTEITGRIPSLPWLTLRAGHRSQLQHGDVQARTLAKCSNCHISAVSKRIDQRLHDLTAGLSLRFSHVAIDYDYLNRQFNERGLTPSIQYDDAVHPATLTDVFGNRVSFDNAQGLFPFSQVPDVRKSAHSLKARFGLPKEAKLSAALTSSHGENKFTGLGVDALGWSSKFTVPLGKRVNFVARFKKLDVDADDVFVDLGEPVSTAGPQAGKTFSEAYPGYGSVDYWRRSVVSRSQVTTSAELGARLAKFTTVRGGYQFNQVKRDNFEIEKSDTNRVFASFLTRQSSKRWGDWSGRIRYLLEHTRDPFTYRNAALPPELQPKPSPGNPPSPLLGTQYYTMYAARQANLTNFPNWSHSVEPSWTWSPNPRVSMTLHYRLRSEKNTDLNFSDWERDVHMPGAELWVAPTGKLNFTLAYSFQNERSRSLFVLPAFDG